MSLAVAKRRVGRPRMREDRQLFMRNLEFRFMHLAGVSIAAIARQKGVSRDTVKRGLADAETYFPEER